MSDLGITTAADDAARRAVDHLSNDHAASEMTEEQLDNLEGRIAHLILDVIKEYAK